MALTDYIPKLTDGSLDLEGVDLSPLSDLTRDEIEELALAWKEIDPKRRRNIVTTLSEKARDSVQFDFNSIFLMSLRDSDEDVRFLSIYGLAEYEDRPGFAPLSDILLGDESPRVRAAAAEALARYAHLAAEGKLLSRNSQRLHEAFLEVLGNDLVDEQVRQKALEGVAYYNDADIRALIQNFYTTGSIKMRRSAVVAMGRNGDPIWLETIAGELSNVREEMRIQGAVALGELGEEDGVPYLIATLKDDDSSEVQLAIIQALGKIGGSLAKLALKKVHESGDEVLKEASEEALHQFEFDNNPLGPAV
ncbi:MAG: HEAT repeat [Chloroflexi bacterium]|jgi:HEAT repeat protein|nr:MAG: HEAT repeat [Chloroflexota bacterium]